MLELNPSRFYLQAFPQSLISWLPLLGCYRHSSVWCPMPIASPKCSEGRQVFLRCHHVSPYRLIVLTEQRGRQFEKIQPILWRTISHPSSKARSFSGRICRMRMPVRTGRYTITYLRTTVELSLTWTFEFVERGKLYVKRIMWCSNFSREKHVATYSIFNTFAFSNTTVTSNSIEGQDIEVDALCLLRSWSGLSLLLVRPFTARRYSLANAGMAYTVCRYARGFTLSVRFVLMVNGRRFGFAVTCVVSNGYARWYVSGSALEQ